MISTINIIMALFLGLLSTITNAASTCKDYILTPGQTTCAGEQYIGLQLGQVQGYPTTQPILCHCKNEIDYQQQTTETSCPYGYYAVDMFCEPKPVNGNYPNQTGIPPLCADQETSTMGFYEQCYVNCKSGFVSFVNQDPFNNKWGFQSCIQF
eukprot:Pgem_evm1s8963